MPNIFKQSQQVNDHPKRNNFDLSKKINASFKFGTLYPVYCQPVVPGDSFSIDTAFNIKAMPVVFPVQTKMRAHMHYFYVRNKNLWNNWENWISNLPNASQDLTPHPFISRPDVEFTNGSIHDFLGVPTSVASSSPIPVTLNGQVTNTNRDYSQKMYGFCKLSQLVSAANTSGDMPVGVSTPSSSTGNMAVFVFNGVNVPDEIFLQDWLPFVVDDDVFSQSLKISVRYFSSIFKQLGTMGSGASQLLVVSQKFIYDEDLSNYKTTSNKVLACVPLTSYVDFEYKFDDATVARILADDGLHFFAVAHPMTSLADGVTFSSVTSYVPQENNPSFIFATPNGVVEYSKLGYDLFSNHLHINALPYRAYESCVNAYYRNNVVDPLIVNGQVQYNKYIPNDGDGADTFKYELHQRNYELDFLTSALPSPQQGVAPMVGVTALGDITIEDENGLTTARADVDSEGFVTKVVLTSPAASNDHARTLMNIAASGFNINDFRQTNALQRLLETTIRKGYKYKDFIAGHFGIEPKYVELDMPEFIGGFSRDVNVATVISNADTLGDNSGAALGEYGGYAQVVGGSNHSVRHYCDDYGFIMGILCITPTPCYSQLLPKHMIAPDNFLDYPFPEFNSVGMQPITYKEVAPIQSYIDSLTDPDKRLEDTFGYQRPNYDMVAAVDEVHGDFRGSLRNYVINRIFDTRPELGHDFIAVRPEEVNDIFVDTDPRDDTFIGEIAFGVHAKRPFPRVVIPNLGR